MANQITHIALAKLAKQTNPNLSHFDHRDFLLGTTFPDIRYLGVIAREQTHFEGLLFSDITTEKNEFKTGQMYHSFVDKAREKFMADHGIYTLVPEHKYITQTMKSLEDEVYYPHITDWQSLSPVFDIILEEERAFNIPDEPLIKWHKLIKDYISEPPSDASRKKFILGLGFPEDLTNEINGMISDIRQNPQVITILNTFWDEFPSLLK